MSVIIPISFIFCIHVTPKLLILLFADDQCIISDTEDNLQKAVYSLYNKSKEFNLEITTNKTKVFGFLGTDHLRAKIIINDEILEQVNQFTYLAI